MTFKLRVRDDEICKNVVFAIYREDEFVGELVFDYEMTEKIAHDLITITKQKNLRELREYEERKAKEEQEKNGEGENHLDDAKGEAQSVERPSEQPPEPIEEAVRSS